MATLTFAAGPITSSLTASNAKADTIVTNFLYAYNDNDTVDGWTNQEKADAFMAQLRRYILGVSNSWKREDAADTARDATADDDWIE